MNPKYLIIIGILVVLIGTFIFQKYIKVNSPFITVVPNDRVSNPSVKTLYYKLVYSSYPKVTNLIYPFTNNAVTTIALGSGTGSVSLSYPTLATSLYQLSFGTGTGSKLFITNGNIELGSFVISSITQFSTILDANVKHPIIYQHFIASNPTLSASELTDGTDVITHSNTESIEIIDSVSERVEFANCLYYKLGRIIIKCNNKTNRNLLVYIYNNQNANFAPMLFTGLTNQYLMIDFYP